MRSWLASALRERRPADQERTKPRDKKSPHTGPPSQLQMNALPEPKSFATPMIETLMWIKVKSTVPTRSKLDRSLGR
jgi:hypothetical protein